MLIAVWMATRRPNEPSPTTFRNRQTHHKWALNGWPDRKASGAVNR